jgi:hypothetical protein
MDKRVASDFEGPDILGDQHATADMVRPSSIPKPRLAIRVACDLTVEVSRHGNFGVTVHG